MAAVYYFICVREAYPSPLPTVAGSQPNFNRSTANALANIRKSRHGIGDILARPNANAIKDHLLCDGSAISRQGFTQLFTEIGTEWGAGDGLTTFNLPNLIGSVPVATTAPEQTVTDGGTVSTGGTVTQPSDPGQTGGTSGGNVPSGGRPTQPNTVSPP